MATAKIILYKHKTLSDGTFPVVIQVINNRKITRKSVHLSCLPDQWNEEASAFNKSFPDFRKANVKLDKIKALMHKSLERFDLEGVPFSIDRFFNYMGKSSKPFSVLESFEATIQKLVAEGRIGNSLVYKDTRNDIKRFIGRLNPMFHDIDYGWLVRFESFLKREGYADSSIHIRMRTIRASFNEAIRLGIVPSDYYPFAKSSSDSTKYSLSRLTLTKNPRGLDKLDLNKIKTFDEVVQPHLLKTKNLFLFSYYANGMNYSDMAYLKWEDIYEGRIRYKRQKTGLFMEVFINDSLAEILSWFRTNSHSNYVFPILNDSIHATAVSRKERIKRTLKEFNRDLKELGEILGIDLTLTSYVARHTYAQVLQTAGTGQGDIQHQLGHKDLRTTQVYLANLSSSRLDYLSELL